MDYNNEKRRVMNCFNATKINEPSYANEFYIFLVRLVDLFYVLFYFIVSFGVFKKSELISVQIVSINS